MKNSILAILAILILDMGMGLVTSVDAMAISAHKPAASDITFEKHDDTSPHKSLPVLNTNSKSWCTMRYCVV